MLLMFRSQDGKSEDLPFHSKVTSVATLNSCDRWANAAQYEQNI